VATTLQKGSFKALRLLPRIRTTEERDALGGQYPPSPDTREMPVAEQVAAGQDGGGGTPSLFPLE